MYYQNTTWFTFAFSSQRKFTSQKQKQLSNHISKEDLFAILKGKQCKYSIKKWWEYHGTKCHTDSHSYKYLALKKC